MHVIESIVIAIAVIRKYCDYDEKVSCDGEEFQPSYSVSLCALICRRKLLRCNRNLKYPLLTAAYNVMISLNCMHMRGGVFRRLHGVFIMHAVQLT